MLSMIDEAKSQVIFLTTGLGSHPRDIAGIFDGRRHAFTGTQLQFQIITEISSDKPQSVERIDRNVTKDKLNFKIRHINMSSNSSPVS
jgi:hypothetical protein